MSKDTVPKILKRIEIATKDSPIAVFNDNGLNAVFAATVDTWLQIGRGDPNLIGVFYGDMDLDRVKIILEEIE
jgi:hypothetical protein